MSIGAALKLFVLALIIFAVAFGLRRTFFWDVTPVSWDREPQSLWALGAAFLLRSLENIAAAMMMSYLSLSTCISVSSAICASLKAASSARNVSKPAG
jgi:hypothetical protein